MSDVKILFNFNLEEALRNLEQYLLNFSKINSPIDILNSQEAYETITLVQILTKYTPYVDKTQSLLLKYNAHEKLAQVFEYLSITKSEFNFKDINLRKIIDFNDPNVCYLDTSLNERRIFNLVNIDHLFNYILNLSIETRRLFTRVNENNTTYLKSFLTFIEDYEFIEGLMEYYPKFSGFMLNLSVISKNVDECKHIWQDLNAVEKLLKFGRRYKQFNFNAYGVIATVASDQDIEKLTELNEINEIITILVEYTIRCINSPDGKRKLQFKDDDEKEEHHFAVSFINDKDNHFCSITHLLSCLYRLSVSERIKLDIYKRNNFIKSLQKIIINGIDIEKQYALQLLAQLSFNIQVNQEINKEIELIDYIRKLDNSDRVFDYKKLKKTCKEFLWILEKNSASKLDRKMDDGHIMISYNTESRQTCLKIKKELELLKYRVWIDVSEIHGSSLESMAQAIENASCVLMCVTEKYRQSLNCQAEAQYAFRLKKLIIPVIMQTGYQNISGWLGIIIGDKIFVDFTKYSLDESMARLIKQIQLVNNHKDHKVGEVITEINQMKINNKQETTNGPKNWNTDQVKDWLCSNNLDSLNEVIGPINGRVLFQLYEIKQHTPEFFFKSITKNDNIEIRTVAIFSDLIMELFK